MGACAVQDRGCLDARDIGVALMRKAFNDVNGPLSDMPTVLRRARVQ